MSAENDNWWTRSLLYARDAEGAARFWQRWDTTVVALASLLSVGTCGLIARAIRVPLLRYVVAAALFPFVYPFWKLSVMFAIMMLHLLPRRS